MQVHPQWYQSWLGRGSYVYFSLVCTCTQNSRRYLHDTDVDQGTKEGGRDVETSSGYSIKLRGRGREREREKEAPTTLCCVCDSRGWMTNVVARQRQRERDGHWNWMREPRLGSLTCRPCPCGSAPTRGHQAPPSSSTLCRYPATCEQRSNRNAHERARAP